MSSLSYRNADNTRSVTGCLKGLQNRQYLVDFKEQFITAIKGKIELLIAFITAKKKANFKLIK